MCEEQKPEESDYFNTQPKMIYLINYTWPKPQKAEVHIISHVLENESSRAKLWQQECAAASCLIVTPVLRTSRWTSGEPTSSTGQQRKNLH